jgi:hypothetical protein
VWEREAVSVCVYASAHSGLFWEGANTASKDPKHLLISSKRGDARAQTFCVIHILKGCWVSARPHLNPCRPHLNPHILQVPTALLHLLASLYAHGYGAPHEGAERSSTREGGEWPVGVGGGLLEGRVARAVSVNEKKAVIEEVEEWQETRSEVR